VGGWIRTFCNVVQLEYLYVFLAVLVPSYVSSYGLSPTVRSLRLTWSTVEVFDLVCPFRSPS